MNVLLFVTSILMILSLMTYARVDSFRYFMGMEAQFERYMSSIERNVTNAAAVNWYDSTKAKTGGGGGGGARSKAAPRLSFRILVDQKMRQSKPQEYAQIVQWTKNLMTKLYGNQAFFKEAEAKNPFFLDQIIEKIGNLAEALPKGQALQDAAELSNLNLGPDLEKTFYLMLKGCLREELLPVQPAPPERRFSIELPETENTQGSDEEDEVAEEAEEYTGAIGYDSLLNYITLRDTTQIRIYLAPKPVLEAIFGDAAIADQIIRTRYELYNAVKNDGLPPADATEQLKAQVHGHLGNENDSFFDFKVTKTDPSRYN